MTAHDYVMIRSLLQINFDWAPVYNIDGYTNIVCQMRTSNYSIDNSTMDLAVN